MDWKDGKLGKGGAGWSTVDSIGLLAMIPLCDIVLSTIT